MRTLLSLAVLLGGTSFACAAGPTGGKERLDRAIDNALQALQRTQERDGSWLANARQKNPAITSLCVMAYLSAGQVPGEGRYGDTIKKGVEYVLKQQLPNGLIAQEGGHEMYHHGICTLMLSEVAGMVDEKQGAEVRKALEKAVEVILTAQRTADPRSPHYGGWRYRVRGIDSDLSVTGWQVMALRAAKNLGCDVPSESIDLAIEYIKRCQDPNTHGFRYFPNSRMTLPCTGTGILALEICGKNQHHSDEVEKAGSFLIQERNLPRWGSEHFFYGIYYSSQASFQLGRNYWAVFRPELHKVLLDNQSSTGVWQGNDAEGRIYGANYCTAMGVLALTVEYRYLPIYQRGEEPTEK
jgi:hypothetical protein